MFNQDISRIISVIRKNLAFLLIFTGIGVSLVAGYTLFIAQPIYSVKTTYLLKNESQTESNAQSLEDITLFQKLMKTYLEIADLPTVREQTDSALKLSDTEQAKIKSVSLSNATDSQLIEVEVRATDRTLASRYIDEYANLYKEFTAEKFGRDSLQVISENIGSERPVSPSLPKNILVATAVFLFIGLNGVLLRYVLGDSIDSHEDLEKLLEVPVMGMIPASGGKGKGKK